MKTIAQVGSHAGLPRFSDRQLNRLIIGVAMILLVGIPTLGVVYWFDRAPDTGPPLVERKITELEAAVRANPNTISIRLQLAGAYGAAKRYQDAIGQLDAVLAARPDDKTALVDRGDFYRVLDLPDKAMADYSALIALAKDGEFAKVDVQLHQAYYSLGAIQLTKGDTKAAIEDLKAALVIKPTDADTLNLLGTAYVRNGEAAKGVEKLRSAVLFVPTGWADPYTALAAAYTALGQADAASWAGAMADFATGRPQPAHDQLSKLTSGPVATDAYVGLGLIAESTGDDTAALAAYAEALKRDPDNFTAQSGQARASGAAVPADHGVPAASQGAGGS